MFIVSLGNFQRMSCGLTSQYKRAAASIPLNIAEGSGDTDAQINRYLQMAWDSVKECVVCSTIARRQDLYQ